MTLIWNSINMIVLNLADNQSFCTQVMLTCSEFLSFLDYLIIDLSFWAVLDTICYLFLVYIQFLN